MTNKGLKPSPENAPSSGEEDAPTQLSHEGSCPECGAYYTLIHQAPPFPEYLLDDGEEAEERWYEQNPNIWVCSACGWREDE